MTRNSNTVIIYKITDSNGKTKRNNFKNYFLAKEWAESKGMIGFTIGLLPKKEKQTGLACEIEHTQWAIDNLTEETIPLEALYLELERDGNKKHADIIRLVLESVDALKSHVAYLIEDLE